MPTKLSTATRNSAPLCSALFLARHGRRYALFVPTFLAVSTARSSCSFGLSSICRPLSSWVAETVSCAACWICYGLMPTRSPSANRDKVQRLLKRVPAMFLGKEQALPNSSNEVRLMLGRSQPPFTKEAGVTFVHFL